MKYSSLKEVSLATLIIVYLAKSNCCSIACTRVARTRDNVALTCKNVTKTFALLWERNLGPEVQKELRETMRNKSQQLRY